MTDDNIATHFVDFNFDKNMSDDDKNPFADVSTLYMLSGCVVKMTWV